MFEQTFAIARNTFVESIRQPIYLIMIGVGVLALCMNLGLSAFTLKDDNKLLIDMGLATIFLCGLLIAAFVATSVLAQEIRNKTALTVVSKPVGRPLFILGKYVGVSAAIIVAGVILSIAFMFTVRHQVMQRASDELDIPVFVFGFGAIILSVGIGVWGNYFYNWMFPSATITALLPLSIVAWLLLLAFDKEWKFQLFSENAVFISPDLNPQLIVALYALFLALLLISAVAIAASARLGQVMTIVTCLLVFTLGLLSDHFFGRRAYETEPIARIVDIEYGRDADEDFDDDEDFYLIQVDKSVDIREGLEVAIAADPVGLSVVTQNVVDDREPAVRLRNVAGLKAELVNVGDVESLRPPRAGDYFVEGRAKVNYVWRALWSVPPNLQFLVLIDPITQGHIIPLHHLVLLTTYSILYITVLLCLAVILFQTREVG